MADEISLRKICSEDLELLMAWRNHPKIYRHLSDQDDILSWKEHCSWFENRPKDRIDWLVIYDDSGSERKIGSANISELSSEEPEIGLYIGELDLWSEGFGTKILKKVLQKLRQKGYEKAVARINKENKPSISLFKKLDFEKVDEIEGEYKYRVELTS